MHGLVSAYPNALAAVRFQDHLQRPKWANPRRSVIFHDRLGPPKPAARHAAPAKAGPRRNRPLLGQRYTDAGQTWSVRLAVGSAARKQFTPLACDCRGPTASTAGSLTATKGSDLPPHAEVSGS